MIMYHTKEVMNFNKPMTNFEPKPQPAREGGELTPIRFGELSVGSKFVYGGCWLVKTGDYVAESDSKRDKTTYLFFKKDVVKSNKRTGDVGFFYCPYIPGLPANGSLQPTDFKESRTKMVPKDDLFTATSVFVEKPKLQCEIIITPGFNIHQLKVVCSDGYRWETHFKGEMSGSWSTPIRLKNIELILKYDREEIQLYYEDKKVWYKEFYGWEGVTTCSINIRDMVLDSLKYKPN